MSNDLLKRVVDTTRIGSGGGGLLSPDQTNRFIDYMWDQTVLGQSVRRLRLRADSAEVERIHLGTRLARHATEGVDDHVLVAPTFTKVSLRTEKIRLDWELTTEVLEDNMEGDDLEDHVARLMANQLGNDLEDLAINGEAASADPLLTSFDGYRRLAFTGSGGGAGNTGAHLIDNGGEPLTKATFNAMYRALPTMYKQRRADLRWYTSPGIVADYTYQLTNTEYAIAEALVMGDRDLGAGIGNTGLRPFGIPLFEIPLQFENYGATLDTYETAPAPGSAGDTNRGYVTLTFPQNHIWAVKREIKVFREFKPKKDAIEYTVFTRVGTAIDDYNSYVVAYNVANETPATP